MRLYSYVVRWDFGFAPNPFYGYCTLATCKPAVRRTAAVHDLIIGTGSAERKRAGYLVYAMLVTELSAFDDYWHDTRFAQKKPNMHGSKKQSFGDNIYHRASADEQWIQADSHHSYANGTPNHNNVTNDTASLRVLISNDFTYFGGEGPEIPKEIRFFNGHDICQRRGYRNHFPAELIDAVVDWWRSLDTFGCVGKPLDWSRTA